jgi:hypothetical protein
MLNHTRFKVGVLRVRIRLYSAYLFPSREDGACVLSFLVMSHTFWYCILRTFSNVFYFEILGVLLLTINHCFLRLFLRSLLDVR